MPCSSTNDVTVNVDLIRLDSGDFRVTLNRGAKSDVSLLGASLKFTIGPNYDTALQTVPDGDFDKTTETADQLVAVFSIDENLLANSLPKQDTQLYFVFTVTAANARATQATLRGAIDYKDSFPADGPIVVPETVGPTTIVRYSEVDPRNGTEGQALIQDANGVFVPTTLAGGGGVAQYSQTFTDADLSISDLLPVNHNLSRNPAGVIVEDSSGEIIEPDVVTVLTANSISLLLSSFRPLNGTWRVQVT